MNITTYYLELMFINYILFRIDVYFSEYNLVIEVRNLSELILIKKIMMEIVKLVEYKNLSESSKIKN